MASLQRMPSGNYHILFRFGGIKYKRSLKTKELRKANSLKSRLEDTIDLVNMGHIDMPDSIDVPTFLLSEGRRAGQVECKEGRLGDLFESYLESIDLTERISTADRARKS